MIIKQCIIRLISTNAVKNQTALFISSHIYNSRSRTKRSIHILIGNIYFSNIRMHRDDMNYFETKLYWYYSIENARKTIHIFPHFNDTFLLLNVCGQEYIYSPSGYKQMKNRENCINVPLINILSFHRYIFRIGDWNSLQIQRSSISFIKNI